MLPSWCAAALESSACSDSIDATRSRAAVLATHQQWLAIAAVGCHVAGMCGHYTHLLTRSQIVGLQGRMALIGQLGRMQVSTSIAVAPRRRLPDLNGVTSKANPRGSDPDRIQTHSYRKSPIGGHE